MKLYKKIDLEEGVLVQYVGNYILREDMPPEVGFVEVDDADDIVILNKAEYFQLCLAQETLRLLEEGGVDNWNGYGESLYRNADIDAIEEELRKEIFDNPL